ncbi:hypothetical protein EX30DRAFT_368575 [Ascodesmis nigricans]|uniref:Nuclear protein DGCR14 n=1 Tax=Ascodesmis nigricans TaxID=341454 RepID=A0A4S2N824_9PEZI|nr:hypothetical protein EX30DRAFT_368575 [Ascodesmis nigricans]
MESPTSNALARKRTDTELMPPPPPLKKIKRPAKVLDEDTYTDALSEIIARDFFPGLLETKHQQEYLDALESDNQEWIAEASKKLTEVMNTPQHRRRGTSFATPRFGSGGYDTPILHSTSSTPQIGISGTPSGSGSETAPEKEKVDISLSLSAFQAKYTSEDNESFNELLDKQNEKRRGAYAFLWNDNRTAGFRTAAHLKRLKAQEEQKLITGDVKSMTAPDNRPAIPNTWKVKDPRNSLMFTPDGSPLPSPPRKEGDKELPPKQVVYANTRMPPPQEVAMPERPDSPTSTFIRDAIRGYPRATETEDGYDGGATPRVRGYSFVDDAPSPSPSELGAPPMTWGSVGAVTALPAPATSASTPFKLAATPKRELLHHKMVEKVAKNKRTVSSNPLLSSAKTPSATKMTPLGAGGSGRTVPKFASSPAMTPAGMRLWSNLQGRKESGLREGLWERKETGKSVRGLSRFAATPRAK